MLHTYPETKRQLRLKSRSFVLPADGQIRRLYDNLCKNQLISGEKSGQTDA